MKIKKIVAFIIALPILPFVLLTFGMIWALDQLFTKTYKE